MYIYNDEADAIASVRAECERQVNKCSQQLANVPAKSHVAMTLRGERGAYAQILAMLTDYALRNEPSVSVEVVEGQGSGRQEASG